MYEIESAYSCDHKYLDISGISHKHFINLLKYISYDIRGILIRIIDGTLLTI